MLAFMTAVVGAEHVGNISPRSLCPATFWATHNTGAVDCVVLTPQSSSVRIRYISLTRFGVSDWRRRCKLLGRYREEADGL